MHFTDQLKDWRLIASLAFVLTIILFKLSNGDSAAIENRSEQLAHSSEINERISTSVSASAPDRHRSLTGFVNPFGESQASGSISSQNNGSAREETIASTTPDVQINTDESGVTDPIDRWISRTFGDGSDGRVLFSRAAVIEDESQANDEGLSVDGKPASRNSGRTSAVSVASYPDDLHNDAQNHMIKGRVFSSSGLALGGVSVQSLLRGGPQADNVRASALTADDGSFTLAELIPGDYSINVQGDDLHGSVSKVLRTGDLSATVILPALEYWSVQGQVVDEFGSPISSARVIVERNSASSETDGSGNFALRVSADNHGGLLLRYEAEGYESVTRHLTGTELRKKTVNASAQLRYTGSLILSGTVTDQRGDPVHKALVSVVSRKPSYTLNAHTDEHGGFLIADALPSNQISLSVSAGNQFQRYALDNLALREDIHIPVALSQTRTSTLLMHVTDSAGMPIPSMSFFTVDSSSGSGTQVATSDNQGQLSIDGIRPGRLMLRSSAKSPNVVVRGISVGDGYDVVKKITVDTGIFNLRGQILDFDGSPLANTSVTMTFAARHGAIQSITSRTLTSDPDGKFLFTGIGSGERQIKVAARGGEERIYIADPLAYSNGESLVLQ